MQNIQYGRNTKKKDITVLVVCWLLVILFGPYIYYKVLFRLDHLILPVFFLISLGHYFKHKSLVPVATFLYPLAIFIAVVCFATYGAVKSGEYTFHLSFGLGDFENHCRILMTAVILGVAGIYYKIQVKKILRAVFWMAIILSLFGILQTITIGCESVSDVVRLISLSLYEGFHFRGKGAVEICLGSRAVSTFYSPGNLGLFLGLICSFFYCCSDVFPLRKITNIIGIFLIVSAGILSISKIFLGFYFIIIFCLVLKKRITQALFAVAIFLLSFIVVGLVEPYAVHVYKINIVSVFSPVKFYNIWAGPRFGKLTVENNIGSTAAGILEDETTGRTIAVEDGYLAESLIIIRNHPLVGVGYVLVKSGDSFVNHLLVRGGLLGSVSFLLFLLLLAKIVAQNINKRQELHTIYSGWQLCFFAFTVAGIGYPTFIQDRSGDVFWLLSFLLATPDILSD